MNKIIYALALCGCMGLGAQAQEKIDIKVTGRALFDAAAFS